MFYLFLHVLTNKASQMKALKFFDTDTTIS